MTMTDQQKAEWKVTAKLWLSRITKSLDEDHPNFLVAHGIACLLTCALGYIPKEMAEELGKILIERGRNWTGLCADINCDNEVNPYRTGSIYCGKCNAQTTADVFTMEMEMEYDKPEEQS